MFTRNGPWVSLILTAANISIGQWNPYGVGFRVGGITSFGQVYHYGDWSP